MPGPASEIDRAMKNAQRMARLRAACRTGGARNFYGAIRRAHWDTVTGGVRARDRRQHFRYARYGTATWTAVPRMDDERAAFDAPAVAVPAIE